MFNCEVIINGECVHKQDYKTLSDISKDLNLSYHQVAEYSAGRVKRRLTNHFKFHPMVSITKLPKSQ